MICKDMEKLSPMFSENSCILEVVPSNFVLDKRWFVKCLNRGNDRFFKALLENEEEEGEIKLIEK